MRATVGRSAKRSVNRPFHGRVLCGHEPQDWVVDRGSLRAGMRRMRPIVKDLPIRAADYLKRGIFRPNPADTCPVERLRNGAVPMGELSGTIRADSSQSIRRPVIPLVRAGRREADS